MINDINNDLTVKGIFDSVDDLGEKIGNSSIISAQLCKELYSNEVDYFWEIHKALYDNEVPQDPNFALSHIVNISIRNISKKRFRILTYNFDDYLERYLDSSAVEYNSLFSEHYSPNDNLSIYHVHGFLPKVAVKSHMHTSNMKSIRFTEQDYNNLYNDPYSWQISSQLSFFRENICLFVGLSLTDPNIRRLLELTSHEFPRHYALLTRGSLTDKDLQIATAHFYRLGIEVIWADDFDDVRRKLRNLY